MTLVVARQLADSLVLVGDTKVTGEQILHPSLHHAALKTIVVSESLCISFAGNVQVAQQALASVLSSKSHLLDNVVAHLHEAHRASQREVDFIVAGTRPNAILVRIAGDALLHDVQATWIGDANAFAAFQRAMSGEGAALQLANPDDEIALTSRMKDALQTVIDGGAFPSVGNLVVSVRSGTPANTGFRYNAYMSGSGYHPVVNTTEPTSLLWSVGAEGGSFRYSVLVPAQRGIGAVAFHVCELSAGVLFYPTSTWEPIVVRNVSTQELIDRVSTNFGIKLEGILFA